jgi:hypothetical protein
MKAQGGVKRVLDMLDDGWRLTTRKGYDLGGNRATATKGARTIVVRYRHARKAAAIKTLRDLRLRGVISP